MPFSYLRGWKVREFDNDIPLKLRHSDFWGGKIKTVKVKERSSVSFSRGSDNAEYRRGR